MVIVGAGPCGLGLRARARTARALRLDDLRANTSARAATRRRSSMLRGFTWDLGGHVVFSHFGEFDALLDEAMGDDVYEHERSSYVRFGGRWVPYPFQNNLRYLEPDVVYECLLGLIEADGTAQALDFATWMSSTFGDGITRHFMRPYNEKVWATPPEEMSADWIAERVSVVDYRRALANVRAAARGQRLGTEQHVPLPAGRRDRRDLPADRRGARPSRHLRQGARARRRRGSCARVRRRERGRLRRARVHDAARSPGRPHSNVARRTFGRRPMRSSTRASPSSASGSSVHSPTIARGSTSRAPMFRSTA